MKYFKYLFLIATVIFTSNILAQLDAPKNLKASTVKLQYENGTKLVVKLDWDKVKNSNGNDVPMYEVFKKDGGKSENGEFVSLGNVLWQNTKFDKHVEDGKTYTYYVIAKDGKGNESAPSDKVEITVSSTIAGTESATISGKVTDETNGNPLEGVYVTFFSTTTLIGKTVVSDADGNYSASLLPGDYIAYFKAPQDYFPEYYEDVAHVTDATFLSVGENETLTGIDAALKPISSLKFYHVSGKVTDTNGNPVMASVSLVIMSKYNFPIRHRHARTDANGNYSIKVREGVEVIVHARPLHSKPLYGEFYNNATSMADAERLTVDGDIDNIDFVLDVKPQGSANVSGKVMNANNEAVQGMIVAINMSTPRINKRGKLRTFTNDSGEYSFEGLPAGNYLFFIIPEAGYLPTFYKADGSTTLKWKDADVITLEDGANINDLNFNLETVPQEAENAFAEIRGKVLDNTGAPVVDAYVYVYNTNKEIISYTFTDANGKYDITGITPGVYSVAVNEYGLENGQNDNVVAGTNEPGTANFTLNSETVTEVESLDKINSFKLNQNYPNPFNPTTKISFSIAEKGKVQLKVYDIIGKEIKTLVNGELNAGVYNLTFDASNLPSGIYIYEIRTDKFLASKKMLLLK